MSSLWRVSVIDTGTDWVDLEVIFSHPDAGPFPEDPVFALCLLTGEAYKFDANWNRIPGCPLGMAIPFEKSYQPLDIAPRVDEFVNRVLIYEAHNLPWDGEAALERVDQEVLNLGIERNSEEWKDAWQDQWRRFWKDKNNLPRAIYRIWATDPKWLQHLSTGLTYDSAAFSQLGPWVDEDREIQVG